MDVFLKVGDLKGSSTDADHKDWIVAKAVDSAISRNIQAGAKDNVRLQGTTTLSDISVVRTVDKSTVKLAASSARGELFPEVIIHLCAQIKGKRHVLLEYKLKNVILTSWQGHGGEEAEMTEVVTMNYTEVEWVFDDVDHEKGTSKGKVPDKYSVGEGKK